VSLHLRLAATAWGSPTPGEGSYTLGENSRKQLRDRREQAPANKM
jgi:hypothetical protein